MDFNLADLFEAVAAAVGDREALACGDVRESYAELDARANRLAHYLRGAGIGPGDHVGILLYNSVEWVESMLACLKVRAVPINVNYRYVADELAYLFHDSGIVALVTGAEFGDRVRAVAPGVANLGLVIAVGGPVEGAVDYESALAGQPASAGFPPRSGADHYVIYTGGTTGMPKGVVWRQEDLFFAGMAGGDPAGSPATSPAEVLDKLAGRVPLVMFPVAPLMHGAAQLATWIAFVQGQRVVLLPRFSGEEVVRTIERERVNTINIVGDAMARPIAAALAGPCKGADLSCLFAISSAGAILSETVRAELAAGLPNTLLLDSFGASETGFNGMGVLGAPPGTRLRFTMNDRTVVLDDNLEQVKPGSGVIGRVAQRRHVPVGYHGDPEKTAATFVTVDGERHVLLGDLARVEEDGTITVLGRGSLCINTGGEKVFPEEVEAAVKAHPDVADAVVTGVADSHYGERVAAVVALRPGAHLELADLDRHCRARLAGYKVPRVLVLVDTVVRSPSGKPDYPWARRIATEDPAASRESSADRSAGSAS
ncbi:MAG: acyl-CoA synthetase [Mycobacteriales bacterium]